MDRERLAILISGGGTTMNEVAKACQSGELSMDLVCVVASNPQAGGIEKAQKFLKKEQVAVVNPKKIDPEKFGSAILEHLKRNGATIVAQLGWLPLTPELIIKEYQDKMINQHPGPLRPGQMDFGKMHGLQVHAARLYFVRATKREFWTEATIQRVAPKFDEGAILCAKKVSILESDDPGSLAQRVLPIEHSSVIETLQAFAKHKVREINPTPHEIISKDETEIWKDSKRIARTLFPKG